MDHANGLKLAGTLLLAASTTAALSDEQTLVWALSAGVCGGVVAALVGEARLTTRGILLRVIASTLAAPAILLGMVALLRWRGVAVEMTLAPVAALSGIAGLSAWPLCNMASEWVQKSGSGALRALIKRVIGEDKP